MDSLFILFQHIVPQHLLSRLTGWLAEVRHPIGLKNFVIEKFVGHFEVNMSEAAEPDPTAYANFNEFFTRPLVAGARPIADAAIVCPADGAISQLGAIEEGRIFQAKGHSFSTRELLGGDRDRAATTDLLLENGNDAASRAENIAKTSNDEAGGGFLGHRVDVTLSQMLTHPHDAGRIDGLVGGNQHKRHGIVFVS